MDPPAPASSSSGHVLRNSLAIVLALGLCACSGMPAVPYSAREQLDFMSNAMAATPAAKEALWQSTIRNGNGAGSDRSELRAALLQSIPDHSGYDPVVARKRLRNFLAQNPSPELAAVARARIAELDSAASCHDEVQDLRRRMSLVVDIERKQDQQKTKP